jgi:hypothetical protein
MIDVLVTVILIAWFFGISYTAALHGLINFIIWIIVLGFIFIIAQDLFAPVEISSAPVKKLKKPEKGIKIPASVKWLFYFFLSYLITSLIAIIIGVWDSASTLPLWLLLLIPALPFDIILIRHLIKKATTKRHKK